MTRPSPTTLDELLAAHVTHANRAGAVAAVTAAGPVELTVDQLRDPRAFKHLGHPLEAHVDAFCVATGLDEATRAPGGPAGWELGERAWALLVAHHLVPRLGVEVALGTGPHNSAWARLVDGLTDNDDRLDAAAVHTVTVQGEDVAAAFCDVVDGARARTHDATRPSVLRAGLSALVGRRVELHLGGDGDHDQFGVLLALTEDAFVLAGPAGPESLSVVPRSKVVAVHTHQLTADEDAALWPPDPADRDMPAPADGPGDGDPGTTASGDGPGGDGDDEPAEDDLEDAPDEAELLEQLARVWEQWECVRTSPDPVSAAFALTDFANQFFHYAVDRLGFDAVIATRQEPQ